MFCLFFTLAVLSLTLSGLAWMIGWKSAAVSCARVAFAFILGGTLLGWLVDTLRVLVRQPSVQTVAGGLLLLFLLVLILLGVGWILKRRSETKETSRPTIRRREPLMGEEEERKTLPAPAASSSTDDLHLFGGGR